MPPLPIQARLRRLLPPLLITLLAVLVAVGIFSLKDRFGHPVHHKPPAQKIVMIHQPPPPPPPPPEPQPPPPEKQPEMLPEPEPEPEPPQAEEPPPGEDLGVDAEGEAGGDAFGLVGKPGEQGLLGGSGGNALIWYGQQLQREVEARLRQTLGEPARSRSYAVIARIWLAADGAVTRAELESSSGSGEVDGALRDALGKLAGPFKAPPAHLPQPIRLRIRS